MKRFLTAIALLAAGLGLSVVHPGEARAATIYTNISISMWSGPSPDYPRVTRIPAGAVVQVFGCLDDWYWCDVGWRGQRGWVTAGNLYGRYGGSTLFLNQYGPRFGFGIVYFSAGNYWDRYYRNRYSWYRDRDRWVNYRPHGSRPGYYRPDHNRPDYNRPGYNRPGYNRPDDNRPDHNRPGYNRPDNNRPDNNRPGYNRPDNNRPDNNRPGYNRLDSNRPDYNRPGNNRPDMNRPEGRPDGRPGDGGRPDQGRGDHRPDRGQ